MNWHSGDKPAEGLSLWAYISISKFNISALCQRNNDASNYPSTKTDRTLGISPENGDSPMTNRCLTSKTLLLYCGCIEYSPYSKYKKIMTS